MHAFTYSGHPVGCSVALANLDILQREGLLARATELGKQLQAGLRQLESHAHVGNVRSLGLMGGVEFVADKATKTPFPAEFKAGTRVHEAAQRRGMFSRLRGDVYLLAPPLVTTDEQLDRMLNILGEAVEESLG
jgi:adenosylmethionine-8-amino-7-oxononanoate aminotransferase